MSQKEPTINNVREFELFIAKRKDDIKHKRTGQRMTQGEAKEMDHLNCANTLIKVISSMPMTEMVKKVMIARIIEPLRSGKERTHLSIALELGIKDGDVIEMEQIGSKIVSEHLNKYCNQEFIEKFNADRRAQVAIQKAIHNEDK